MTFYDLFCIIHTWTISAVPAIQYYIGNLPFSPLVDLNILPKVRASCRFTYKVKAGLIVMYMQTIYRVSMYISSDMH